MIRPGHQHWHAQQRVVYGSAAAATVAQEAAASNAARVLVTTTRSLTDGALVTSVIDALGTRFAAKFDAIRAHTPRECVIAAAACAREHACDLIVAVGGGSVIDCSKAALLCLWRDIRRLEDFSALARMQIERSRWDDDPQRLRMIAVPTTLSAAEFTCSAGVTDTATHRKHRLSHPLLVPKTVILDPRATALTPPQLFLSSGMRAMDHAVERWLSIAPSPLADATAMQAMEMLARALPAVRRDAADFGARLEAQVGAWLSIIGEAEVGASHGLGYILGAARGVPHGVTSCISLPAVLAWNEPINAERQRTVSAKLGQPQARAADAMRAFVASLGVPGRLADVGIGRVDFAELAGYYDGTGPISTNPRPVRGPQDIVEILALAL